MKKQSSNTVRLNRISIFLDEVGLDQLELAKLLNVSKDTVSRWCRNVNQPQLKELYKIAELGQVDIRSLIEPTHWSNVDGPSAIQIYLDSKFKKGSE